MFPPAPPATLAPQVQGRGWPAALVTLLLLAVFGPYLAGGIRTEQAAVYGLLVAGTAAGWWYRARFSGTVSFIVIVMTANLAVAAIPLIDPVREMTRFLPGNPISGLDNLVLPLATIVVVTWLAHRGSPAILLRRACAVIVVAACANTVVAMWSVTTDAEPVLSAWWGSGDGASTAAAAATMGRYSGVFNQPVEGGLMYSIAAFAAVYRYRTRPFVLAVATVFITVGGSLTASKVFVFIGLPVGAWQLVASNGGRAKRYVALAAVSAIALAVSNAGLFPEQPGKGLITQFLDPDSGGGGAAGLYTSGRFGAGSTIAPLTEVVMGTSPLAGFGAGGLTEPYDNGWLQALVTTGIIGVVGYTAILIALVVGCVRAGFAKKSPPRQLMWGVVITLVGASLGISSITTNRASTLAWVVLALVFSLAAAEGKQRVE